MSENIKLDAVPVRGLSLPPVTDGAPPPAFEPHQGVRSNFERDMAFDFTAPVRPALAHPHLNLGDPVLPDLPPTSSAQRDIAAGVTPHGLAYCRRHLAEAIHILTHLASARMESVGRAKVRHGNSQATAALEGAELELKKVRAGRRAMWVGAASAMIGRISELPRIPWVGFGGAALGQALNIWDKTYGSQRAVDDANWQSSYLSIRERMNKQIEDMQSGEYDKAIRLLERSLETTRQMATSDTDTVKSVSHNL